MRKPDDGLLGSIAATGFGFTALCIGAKRGYVSKTNARERVLDGLRFLWKNLPQPPRLFLSLGQYQYRRAHVASRGFLDRYGDSALRRAVCREYFAHSEIRDLAYHVFNRVDWNWLSEDTPILPHGWTPENGFLRYRWDNYSEMMMMYLLGLGSPTHPLPADAWNAGNAPLLHMTELNISVRSRRSSFISIRKPGSTSAPNATNMPTIS